MVSPVVNEQWYSGGFLVSEMPNTASRDTVLFDNTAGALDLLVQGGTVYSLESYGTPTVVAKAGNTGNGTVSAVSPNTVVTQIGAYVVTMTGATTFTVAAPDGTPMSPGSSAAPYLDGIGFKFTAGGTPNAAGDTYTITTAIGAVPTVAAGGTNVGNGTITAIEQVEAATAMVGNYLVNFTGATTFTVTAPDGRQLAAGTTGTPYEDEIAFTITAGGSAFVAGDAFTIGVGTGAGYATFWTGAAPVAGIIFNRAYVPAGGTKLLTTIVRNAEVNFSELQFANTLSAAAQATVKAQLRALGILPR